MEELGWGFASVRNGWPISKPDLSILDNDIVTAFHSKDMLESIIEKTELDTETVQLLELMGELLSMFTPVML